MTREEEELCSVIKFELIRAIMNTDNDKLLKLIKRAITDHEDKQCTK